MSGECSVVASIRRHFLFHHSCFFLNASRHQFFKPWNSIIVEYSGSKYIPLRWESSKGGESKFPVRNDFSNRELVILDLSNPQEIGLNALVFALFNILQLILEKENLISITNLEHANQPVVYLLGGLRFRDICH